MSYRPAPPRSVASRIMAILSTFLTGKRHSVTEIAHMTGLPVSTTHRLTGDLASWHLLSGRRTAATGSDHAAAAGGSPPPRPSSRSGPRGRPTCARRPACAAGGAPPGSGGLHREATTSGADQFHRECGAACPCIGGGKALLAFSPVVSRPRALGGADRWRSPAHADIPAELHRALGIRLGRAAVARGELFPGQSDLAVPVFGRRRRSGRPGAGGARPGRRQEMPRRPGHRRAWPLPRVGGHCRRGRPSPPAGCGPRQAARTRRRRCRRYRGWIPGSSFREKCHHALERLPPCLKKPEELRSHRWYGATTFVRSVIVHAPRKWDSTPPIIGASRSSRSSTPGATSTPVTRISSSA